MSNMVTTSAPGSFMLMGEHAVLHGHPCLVASASSRIRTSVTRNDSYHLIIRSSLGSFEAPILQLQRERPFHFVIDAVMQHIDDRTTGLEIIIESEMPSTVGLGTSAAVTACVHAALLALSGEPLDPDKVFSLGQRSIRQVQGQGSCADLAASIYGGTLLYRADPVEIVPLDSVCPATLVYSGSKKPTPEVIVLVEKAYTAQPAVYQALYHAVGEQVKAGAEAVREEDWVTLGQLMNMNQGIMEAMGLCNTALAEIVEKLRTSQGIFGAKISGSGLGDCAVGLGICADTFAPYEKLDVQTDSKGLCLE